MDRSTAFLSIVYTHLKVAQKDFRNYPRISPCRLKYNYLKLNSRVFLAGSTVDMITYTSEIHNNDDWAVF